MTVGGVGLHDAVGSLAQRHAELFGMLEVCDKRRPHFDEQRFQLAVRGARDQGLVQRINDLLVVRDFMFRVRLVELGPPEALEMGQGLVTARLQALAGRIVLRCDLEFDDELGGRLVDRSVIRDHPLRERLDFGIRGRGLRELARIDVNLIGRDNDRRDLRVGDALGLRVGDALGVGSESMTL